MSKCLKEFSLKDWLLIILAIILIVFQVNLDLSIPGYMSEITSLIQSQSHQVSDISAIGIKMISASLGSVVAAIIVGYIAAHVAASLGSRLRFKMFNKVSSLQVNEMNQFSVPSLITRSTSDIGQIQLFVAIGLQVIIKSPIIAFSAMSKIMNQSWQWTTLIGGGILFLLGIILVIVFLAVPKFNLVQKLTDNINRITRESLTGIEVVRAYNAQDYQEKKFEDASAQLAKNNLFATRVTALLQPSLNIAMSIMSIGIYWIGAFLIESAPVTQQVGIFSEMVVYSAYALQIIAAFMLLSILLVLMPRAKVSVIRVFEVLDAKASIEEGSQTFADTKLKGTVEFKDVSFTYPDGQKPSLSHISFTANQGDKVAFIGATGSGKTSLINLIPRLYDASCGSVLVNGHDVRDYTYDALYDKIAYVSQKAMLFSGSIESNINFGTKDNHVISDEDVDQAVAISQASEFVAKSEDGIHSAIAQLGTNLSGGQKQRVSIARAIARQAEILIFDDSFSALDYQTDKRVREALDREASDATQFIVAQRIGTIIDADTIIVLDDGAMVGCGTHDELLKTCEVYQEIAASQLSKEELAHEA